ncbi:MAG TPA: G1 family glutamic endopeptidase [Candidatus Dormibacteraeota bacterium]
MFVRSLFAAVIAAAFSFGAVASASAAPDAGTGSTSPNWAGYARTAPGGTAFDVVTASWVEPSAQGPACGQPGASMGIAAISVGLDGYGNQQQERVGTSFFCSPRGAKSTAFYSVCPSGQACHDFQVGNPRSPWAGCSVIPAAGDHITAAVYFRDGHFNFVFVDATQHAVCKAQADNAAPRSSAEATVDVPVPNGAAPLINFGAVNFAGFFAHSDGDAQGEDEGNHDQGEANGHTVAVSMTGPQSAVRAEPGKRHDSRFTVDWKASL